MSALVWWMATAAGGPSEIRVPFPVDRVYDDQPDKVCLILDLKARDTSSLSQLTVFDVDCVVDDDRATVCLTLLERRWPRDVPPVQCGPPGRSVTMRPVQAYDPGEQIWDGVAMLRHVDIYKAVYRVDRPDTPGLMIEGKCGIEDGLFWFETTNPARWQRCILVLEDGTERVVPIRLVSRLRRLGD